MQSTSRNKLTHPVIATDEVIDLIAGRGATIEAACGKEFVVLMSHTSLAQAVSRAEQFRSALAVELIEPLTKPVTSSFSVAELSREDNGESFLSRVDATLYRAKQGRRNRVVAVGSSPT